MSNLDRFESKGHFKNVIWNPDNFEFWWHCGDRCRSYQIIICLFTYHTRINMERAGKRFEDIARKACDLGISAETLASLTSVQKLSLHCHNNKQRPHKPLSSSSHKSRIFHRLFTCSVVTLIMLLCGFLIPLTFMVLHEAELLPDTPQVGYRATSSNRTTMRNK